MSISYTSFIHEDGTVVHEFLDEAASAEFAEHASSWLAGQQRSVHVDVVTRDLVSRIADLIMVGLPRGRR